MSPTTKEIPLYNKQHSKVNTMEEEEKVEGPQLDHKPKEIFETIMFAFDLPKKWNTSWYFNSGASINVNGESS